MTNNSNRLEWLKERQQGLGGSDIAAICGISKYNSPLDIYKSKVEPITDADLEPISEAALFGTKLEDFVATEFAERMGLKVQRVNQQLTGVNPWERANIDRAVVNPDIAGNVRFKDGKLTTNAILECKTASQYVSGHWGASQEDALKQGVETAYQIPKYYLTQVQWYLHITGCDICYVAVLIGSADFRIYKVPRDEAIISIITKEAARFWNENVLKRVPPEPTSAKDVLTMFSQDNGDAVEADNQTAIALGELRNLQAQIKELEEKADEYKNKIIVAIGEHKSLTLGGDVVATYATVSSNRFNTTAFKKQHLDLYNKYAQATSTRRFVLK